ncbi:hypothetical protein Tco_0722517 [Tanacetum coccineum]
MACDVSCKSMMTKLSNENLLLKTQVESTVQERENIKLEYPKLFNSIKATRIQHQQEVNELIENVNQKTYAYSDVRAKNQDLFMIIFELKAKPKHVEKGKNVNTKFDKFVILEKLIYVTSLNKDKAVKAKKVSKTEDKIDKSKPVTSHSTPKNEQILLNTKSKSTSINVKKFSSSVSVVSNKRETLNSTVCQSNSIVLKAKTVNVVNDGLNLVCVSCGIDVFMISHDKYVARYALSVDSKVKRALFTSPTAAKSRNLRATSVVAKSRFSVAKTLTTTNKVSSASSISTESSQRSTLSNYMKNKIATSGKWQNGLKVNQVSIGHPRAQMHKSHLVFLRIVLVIQTVLSIVDNGCSKHMTGNLKLLLRKIIVGENHGHSSPLT